MPRGVPGLEIRAFDFNIFNFRLHLAGVLAEMQVMVFRREYGLF